MTGATRASCAQRPRSYRSFIELKWISYVCVLRVAHLIRESTKTRTDSDCGIRVKGTFYTSNSLIIWLKKDQKEFRNDYGAYAVLLVNQNDKLAKFRTRISVSLIWNRDAHLNLIISRREWGRWNDFAIRKVGLSLHWCFKWGLTRV